MKGPLEEGAKLSSSPRSRQTNGSESLFGEVIFTYTRAQAIADRVVQKGPVALFGCQCWSPLHIKGRITL